MSGIHMTKKEKFLAIYRELLRDNYMWARNDAPKLDRFMTSVRDTIYTDRATWNHDGEIARQAWRDAGGTGKLTLKALRAL